MPYIVSMTHKSLQFLTHIAFINFFTSSKILFIYFFSVTIIPFNLFYNWPTNFSWSLFPITKKGKEGKQKIPVRKDRKRCLLTVSWQHPSIPRHTTELTKNLQWPLHNFILASKINIFFSNVKELYILLNNYKNYSNFKNAKNIFKSCITPHH